MRVERGSRVLQAPTWWWQSRDLRSDWFYSKVRFLTFVDSFITGLGAVLGVWDVAVSSRATSEASVGLGAGARWAGRGRPCPRGLESQRGDREGAEAAQVSGTSPSVQTGWGRVSVPGLPGVTSGQDLGGVQVTAGKKEEPSRQRALRVREPQGREHCRDSSCTGSPEGVT